jgi:hypothetical protein
MKYIFMLLILFVTIDPVLAEQAEKPGKCLDRYRTYLNDFEPGQSQPRALLLYFSNICMPESAHSEDPHYLKLLQRMDEERQVITIHASLSSYVLMES